MKELRENNMEHLLKKREVVPWNHRNKLVLPAPQISDSELQEVVKENDNYITIITILYSLISTL